MAGQVVHIEFVSGDSDRAQTFYEGLFGWKFEKPDMGAEMDYRVSQEGKAGIYVDANRSGHPTIYLGVDNIDESIERVRELGGEAEDRRAIPGVGWFSPCRDTEGTAFQLFQPDGEAS